MNEAIVIPESVYYFIGVMILTNLATIGTVCYTALKAAWWLSKLDSRVDEAKAAAVRAHQRIDAVPGAKP